MKRCLSVLLLSALFAGGCSDDTPGRGKYEHPVPADEVRIVTFNVCVGGGEEHAWEVRREACRTMVRTEDPDIICLQEALTGHIDYLLGGGLPWGLSYRFTGSGRDGGSAGEHTAIFFDRVRFGMKDGGTFWLSETPAEVSYGWDAGNRRIATWAHLEEKATGRELFVLNTHLDHKGAVSRMKSVELIAAAIDQYCVAGIPVVVTGDFNAEPDPELFGPFSEAGLADMRDVAGSVACEYTFNAFGKASEPKIIDYIFMRGAIPLSLRVLDGDYGAEYISDHYPVEAVIAYE